MVTTRSQTKQELPDQNITSSATSSKPLANGTTGRASTAAATKRSEKPKVSIRATKVPEQKTSKKSAAANKSPAIVPVTAWKPGATTFLDLPAELRNEVYASHLIVPTHIAVNLNRPYILEPALLAASRQVRSEALPVWWGENSFEIQGSSPATKFLRSLKPDQIRCLRSINVASPKSPMMMQEPLKWTDYIEERTAGLLREFRSSGLRKSAIRFQHNIRGRLIWANLDELDALESEESSSETDDADTATGS